MSVSREKSTNVCCTRSTTPSLVKIKIKKSIGRVAGLKASGSGHSRYRDLCGQDKVE
jgi:hypothetical protein